MVWNKNGGGLNDFLPEKKGGLLESGVLIENFGKCKSPVQTLSV